MGDPIDLSSPKAKRKRPRGRLRMLPDTVENQPVSPTFLIIERTDEEDFSKVSPFLISKFLNGYAGELKNVKKLKNGTMLIETSNGKQSEKLMKCENFAGQFPIKVSIHSSLNFSKGVIRCYDLQFLEIEEIKKELSHAINDIVRIKIKRNNCEILTNTYIITFPTPKIPESIKIGFYTVKVQQYIPNPMRCFNCLGFAHPTNLCKQQARCIQCGEAKHEDNSRCNLAAKCANCRGPHNALDRSCPVFKINKEIKTIQVTNKIPLNEAKKIYKEQNPTQFNKSFAEIIKQNSKNTEKKDISTQTNTVFNFGENINEKKINSKILNENKSNLTPLIPENPPPPPTLPLLAPPTLPLLAPPTLSLTVPTTPKPARSRSRSTRRSDPITPHHSCDDAGPSNGTPMLIGSDHSSEIDPEGEFTLVNNKKQGNRKSKKI